MKRDGLTEKRHAFCREYIKDCNGTQAAIRAGYSEKTAGAQAEQLLKKLEIQEAIADLRKSVDSEAILEYTEACQVLTGMIRGNVADYLGPSGEIDLGRLRDYNPQAVGGIKQRTQIDENGNETQITEFRLVDRIKAVERLSKLKGWDRPARTEVHDVTPPRYDLSRLTDKQLEQFQKLLELVEP